MKYTADNEHRSKFHTLFQQCLQATLHELIPFVLHPQFIQSLTVT